MTKATYRREYDTTSLFWQAPQSKQASELANLAKEIVRINLDEIIAEMGDAGHKDMPGNSVEVRVTVRPCAAKYSIEVSCEIRETK